MAALDAISIGILFGALLVLAGIMSSLVAMRFGAPLLLVFLIVGMLAGEGADVPRTLSRTLVRRWRALVGEC